jgi:hypothetical protein
VPAGESPSLQHDENLQTVYTRLSPANATHHFLRGRREFLPVTVPLNQREGTNQSRLPE